MNKIVNPPKDADVDIENPPKEIKLWISRLKRCMKDMPVGVWVYIGNGSTCIMTTRNGNPVMDDDIGGVCHDYILDSTEEGNIDGGDW